MDITVFVSESNDGQERNILLLLRRRGKDIKKIENKKDDVPKGKGFWSFFKRSQRQQSHHSEETTTTDLNEVNNNFTLPRKIVDEGEDESPFMMMEFQRKAVNKTSKEGHAKWLKARKDYFN